MLSDAQRRTLLTIARESIAATVERRSPAFPAVDAALERPAGAFVTLELDGRLRGCIGSIEPVAPLFRAVAENAVNAAFRDPRFPPLAPAELRRIHIEISVMSPLETVEADDIEVGVHGVIVRLGPRAGLLLPQVATSQGWDRETLLTETCRKAGLPGDAWRNGGVAIQRFSAEVFAELSD